MTTYYVSQTGSNGNGLSLAAGKTAIAAGIALLSPGDTLLINDGTYNEAIDPNIGVTIPSGSVGAPTIIKAINRNLAILKPSSTVSPGSTPFYIIRTGGTQTYITFDGLVADAGGGSDRASPWGAQSYCYVVDDSSTHITIQNGTARNGNFQYGSGIVLGQFGNTPAGFSMHASILNNDVYHNGQTGTSVDPGAHGIYVDSADNLIEGNRVADNARYAIQCYSALGSGSSNNIIRNNVFATSTAFGVLIAVGANNLFYNNIVYGNGRGLEVRGTGQGIYNNTIYGNGSWGIEVLGDSIGASIKNNIIYGNAGGPVTNSGSGTVGWPTGGTNLTADPSFVSAGSADFHLLSGSAANGTGVNLGSVFTSDFDGITRSAPWDIGAFVFGSLVVTPGVVVPPQVVVPPPVDTPSGIYHPPPVIVPGGSAFIARGGVAPYTFAITSGALPTGLTLNAVGTVTGTPTVAGTFTFTVEVTDSNGLTDSKSCQIVIQPAAPALTYDSMFAFEMLDTGVTSAIAALGFPFPFVLSTTRLDKADFDNDLWYFEIVATNNHASIAYNVILIDGAGATKATISVPANGTVPTLYRSSSFALTAGESDYQVKMPATAANSNVWVRTARMLVQLTASTKAVSSVPLTMNNNLSGAAAEGSITGIGSTARFDSSPITSETMPEHFSIFRFTADHWSAIAEYELQLVYQTNGPSQALVFGLFDVATGIEVSGSHVAMAATAGPLPEFFTLTIAAGALTDGQEVELRGSEPGTETCYLYKARLHVKLTTLAAAEAYLVLSKETTVLNLVSPEARQTFGSTLYGDLRTMFLEAVGSVSGSAGLFHGDLIDDGSNVSGTAGSAVSGGTVSFTTTKARVRSSALPLIDTHYTWKQVRSSGGDTMTTTIAFILVVVEWS